METVISSHITKTSGVCGGRACIAGHRVRVMDIALWHEKRGMSPDEIVDLFPGISLADVHAALTYYFDNPQEIEDEFRRDRECSESLKSHIPSKIPAEMKEQAGG